MLMIASLPLLGPGSGAIATLGISGRAAAVAEGCGIAATVHGAMRMADLARLGVEGVQGVLNNATRTFVQGDGAQVFVQQVGSKFNLVVKGEQASLRP
jgi:hypothetical protein